MFSSDDRPFSLHLCISNDFFFTKIIFCKSGCVYKNSVMPGQVHSSTSSSLLEAIARTPMDHPAAVPNLHSRCQQRGSDPLVLQSKARDRIWESRRNRQNPTSQSYRLQGLEIVFTDGSWIAFRLSGPGSDCSLVSGNHVPPCTRIHPGEILVLFSFCSNTEGSGFWRKSCGWCSERQSVMFSGEVCQRLMAFCKQKSCEAVGLIHMFKTSLSLLSLESVDCWAFER